MTNLDLRDCSRLSVLKCANNVLKSTDFLLSLPHPEKLVVLSIFNNNFSAQNLSFLTRFASLRALYIGNNDREAIRKGIYNRFYGSLETLKNLTNLKELGVANTNIDSGCKYLPESLHFVDHSIREMNYCGLSKIQKEIVYVVNSNMAKQRLRGSNDNTHKKIIQKTTFQKEQQQTVKERKQISYKGENTKQKDKSSSSFFSFFKKKSNAKKNKEENFEKLLAKARKKITEELQERLESLLARNEEVVRNNDSFSRYQLVQEKDAFYKSKSFGKSKITADEVDKLLRLQEEVLLERKFETRVQISPK